MNAAVKSLHHLQTLNSLKLLHFMAREQWVVSVKDIFYPEELEVLKTSQSRIIVSYSKLLIDISNCGLICSIFDKRNGFGFILSIFLT